jgi:hypothetical protein
MSVRVPSSRGFQPRFTLSLLYFFAFFFGFCFVLVAPELLRVLESMPPGPEQEAAAREAARSALAPRLGSALGLAILATGVGIWARLLPGLRSRPGP